MAFFVFFSKFVLTIVNELLENISQGQLAVIDSDKLEDLIDLQDAIKAENHPENKERVSWESIKQNIEIT